MQDVIIHKFLWSLGGAHKGKQNNLYSNFYEFVVTPIWLKHEGFEYQPELGDANYKEHIDIRFWRPGEDKKHSCDVKAPRLGPKGLFVGLNEFTNDICIEDINKNGDPGSLHGKQEWSFYFTFEDFEYYLIGVKQATLKAWVDSLKTSGKVSSSDCVESMSERSRKHKDDMYYRWYRTEGDEDSFMFVPYQDLIESGVVFFKRNVTEFVHQAYDQVIANGGKDYLGTFKYED